jgi:anti-repressor protein
MNEIILQNKDGKILASSRDVAEKFGKQNKHVNESIRKLMVENSTVKNMFFETDYISERGRKELEFLMDRDGFTLLAMGFTGKKALDWKLKYIAAFNKMEEEIKSGNYLSEEEKLKLQLFSKDPLEVVSAHNKLVEIATAPLIEENEELKPKAEFHDAVNVAENCINFGKFAATFQNNNHVSFGRNKIMDWCRDMDYLCSSYSLKNKPSQQMIDSGYMKYKESTNERNGKIYITYTPLLTGKGQIWLTKKLLEYLN